MDEEGAHGVILLRDTVPTFVETWTGTVCGTSRNLWGNIKKLCNSDTASDIGARIMLQWENREGYIAGKESMDEDAMKECGMNRVLSLEENEGQGSVLVKRCHVESARVRNAKLLVSKEVGR